VPGALLTETYPDGRVLTTTYDGANRPFTLSGTLGSAATNYITQTYYWPNNVPWYFVRGSNTSNQIWHVNAINVRMQIPETYESVNNNGLSSMLFVSCPNWGVNPNNYGAYDICPHATTTTDNGTLQGYSEYLGLPGTGVNSNQPFATQTLTYDGLNRLTSATDKTNGTTNWSRAFNYDQWGNFWVAPAAGQPAGIPIAGNTPTSASAFNTANNQIAAFTYDPAGNLKSVGGNTATYNAENQLISVSSGSATETMLYDALGRRVQKTPYGGPTTTYVYDAFGLATEYVNGAWSKDYIADGAGNLYATENALGGACTTCYFGGDHLGSTRLITDQTGKIVARHDFLPYGEEIPVNQAGRTSAWNFGSTTDVTEKFTGQIRDSENGIDYFNARFFTAPLGRFSSPDPGNAGSNMNSSQSWNAYGYLSGNPLNGTDPSGMAGNYSGIMDGFCPASQATCPYHPPTGPITFWSNLPSAVPNDTAVALNLYLIYVRSGAYEGTKPCGWVAGDDPTQILAFYGVDHATKEVDGTAFDTLVQILDNPNCSGLVSLGNGTSPPSLIPMMKITDGVITTATVNDPANTTAVINGNQVTINSYSSNGILPSSPFGTQMKGQPNQAAQVIIHEMMHFAYNQFGASALNPGVLGLKWINNHLNDPGAEAVNNFIVSAACEGSGAN